MDVNEFFKLYQVDSDVSGDYWAELDNEDAAEAVEKINKMVGELSWKQK